jgi:hypothetical protein
VVENGPELAVVKVESEYVDTAVFSEYDWEITGWVLSEIETVIDTVVALVDLAPSGKTVQEKAYAPTKLCCELLLWKAQT